MQCPSCRQEVSGAFCNFCGTTLAAAPAGAGAAAIPATPAASGLSDNAAAAIAYLTIIPSIIFLLIDPYKRIPLVRFHSIQNIALAVVWVAFWISMMILHVILHFIPFIFVLFMLIEMVAGIAFFIGWLVALIKASKGEFFKLPVIGAFAAKQARV
ncbi:MAG TPA: hypothetical protein VFW25_02100 [Silvibacterium sp.]|nr:hypothetical protein [Silvibacterium sp.]